MQKLAFCYGIFFFFWGGEGEGKDIRLKLFQKWAIISIFFLLLFLKILGGQQHFRETKVIKGRRGAPLPPNRKPQKAISCMHDVDALPKRKRKICVCKVVHLSALLPLTN